MPQLIVVSALSEQGGCVRSMFVAVYPQKATADVCWAGLMSVRADTSFTGTRAVWHEKWPDSHNHQSWEYVRVTGVAT